MINYDKIKLEAQRMGISPHLLVKRKYNYKMAKNEKETCFFCQNMEHMNFYDSERVKTQCAFIGESKTDRHADIDYWHTCNGFKNKQLTK